jgi:thioredoxin reductase (NADPH)
MSTPPIDVNYTFGPHELEQLKLYGEVHSHKSGEMLIQEGDRQIDMLITLSGYTEIFVETPDGKKRVGWMERGQFAGDISVLTGQSALATTSMGESGEVLHINHENFQRLLVENSKLSDIFVNSLSARRAFARQAEHGTVIVIGAAQDRTVFVARDLLAKHDVPHTWLDPDQDELATRLMAARGIVSKDLPCVLRGASLTLSKPTPGQLSDAFGLDLLPDGATADVIVVGAGPAGLAASVYAASEGLTVLTLDSTGPGGPRTRRARVNSGSKIWRSTCDACQSKRARQRRSGLLSEP